MHVASGLSLSQTISVSPAAVSADDVLSVVQDVACLMVGMEREECGTALGGSDDDEYVHELGGVRMDPDARGCGGVILYCKNLQS